MDAIQTAVDQGEESRIVELLYKLVPENQIKHSHNTLRLVSDHGAVPSSEQPAS